MTPLPDSGRLLGCCACGAFVREDSFRDQQSTIEFLTSGFCQCCQDRLYVASSGVEGLRAGSIRMGALVGHSVSDGTVDSIAVLPFTFVLALRHLAWDARYVTRIGIAAPMVRGWDLAPMATMLAGHRICVTDVGRFDDPIVGARLDGLDLLVGLDDESLQASVERCPALSSARPVALTDSVPWLEISDEAVLPFESFVRVKRLDPEYPQNLAPVSALRHCARLGAALGLKGPGCGQAKTALSYLLDAVDESFPELRCER